MGCCLTIIDPEEEERENYSRTVTPDIALHNLRDYLVQHRAQDDTHQAIFDAYSVQDSPQEEPYWIKESLRNHITKACSGTTIPETAIDVLWSSFYFYAWHPFPRHDDADKGKIERPAFERAIILLAYKGTEILGTIAHGITRDILHWAYVRHGRPCTCRHNIDRIFRSISQVSTHVHEPHQHSISCPSFVEDDMMDVVATTRPHTTKGIPGSRSLRPTAQRLLQGANHQYRVQIKSLTTLICLLNRVRLYKPTWGRQHLHYGTLEEPSPREDELVNILVQPFQLDQEGFLTPDSMTRGLDILPNLELRFHQLWAIIFQPPVSEASPVLGTESLPDSTMSDILRAVSLFLPPVKEFHGKPELARKIRPVSFETIYQSSTQESNDSLALTHIIQSITEESYERRPHLLLFLADQTQNLSHIPEIMGAFYPATPKKKAAKEEDMCEKTGKPEVVHLQVGLPQLLFQLQPNLRLFRLDEAENTSPPSVHGSAEGYVDNLAAKYWIGDLEESEVGLRIDPVTRQATFVLNQVAANRCRTIYKDVLRINENCEASGEKMDDGIRASFTVTQVAVYRVYGGDEFDPWEANADGVIRQI